MSANPTLFILGICGLTTFDCFICSSKSISFIFTALLIVNSLVFLRKGKSQEIKDYFKSLSLAQKIVGNIAMLTALEP